MTIKTYVSEDDKNVTISIEDRFDFSLHQLFRDAYSQFSNAETIFTLDLSKTSYMDSSALGMILLLKDHAENLFGKVIISQPNSDVNKILEIAQFHRLFSIEH